MPGYDAIEIVEVDDTDAEVVAAATDAILDAAALALGLPFLPDGVHLKASDAEGELVGGLVANVLQGWLFVKFLAVRDAARGAGIGARLLARAEAIALERGLVGVYLDTYEFQAPRFYLREGYREIGRLPAIGGAPQRIWFAKAFEMIGSGT